MKIIKREFATKKFALFLITSGIAAVVNFLSRMVIGIFTSYSVSIVLAYIIGILTAYLLCRAFIFQSKKNSKIKELFWFIAVNCFAILLILMVSLCLYKYLLTFINHTFMREEISHFIGICAPAFTSYIGHKYLSFR